jgi:hypothetical protein
MMFRSQEATSDLFLAPAALALYIVLCGKCVKRIFHTTQYTPCAAKPREHLVREKARTFRIVHTF